MKESDSKNNKIVLFPGLERLLLERGLDFIHQKKYRQAAELLEQARKLDPESGEVNIGLVLAYFESGQPKEAEMLAAEMLREGIGDYFQVIDLYIMILVQLNEYQEIATTIEALLEEREVPNDKFEHFSKMLHFSRKMIEGKTDPLVGEELLEEKKGERLSLFDSQDPKDQMLIAARLAKENIRPYIDEIKVYLVSKEGHPFQKTMLLNILKEQEYDGEVQVKKFGMEEVFIPVALPELDEIEKLLVVSKLLLTRLESEDPVLYENIKAMVDRTFFLIYPFDSKPNSAGGWAAAYHYLVSAYFGREESLIDYAKMYGASLKESEEALDFIKRIEESSYPII